MASDETNQASDIQQVLGLDRPGAGRRRFQPWGVLAVALALTVGTIAYRSGSDVPVFEYRTVEAWRGDLTVTVTATGVIEPVNQVEVGTEVSGTVETVEVDFNDRVRRGQMLARLDTDQLRAKYRQSQALLAVARARVEEMEATLVETRNKLRRAENLAKKGMCAEEECDVARAGYARAEAALASAEAQVVQAEAQRDADATALGKAEIHSPIDGIVLQRQVEPGQTVAASLQTPVLFTLAENLAQMELHVAVDEADVGQVAEGQRATFTVDAHPQRTFEAVIRQVRYAPETVEGVVTYETVLVVDNDDLALRPGMTATADIVVRELEDVLLVANAALRFSPPAEQKATRGGRGLVGSLLPGPPRQSSEGKRKDMAGDQRAQRVWILRDGQPVAVPVRIGASDGQLTQILSGDIEAGVPLLVDATARGG